MDGGCQAYFTAAGAISVKWWQTNSTTVESGSFYNNDCSGDPYESDTFQIGCTEEDVRDSLIQVISNANMVRLVTYLGGCASPIQFSEIYFQTDVCIFDGTFLFL